MPTRELALQVEASVRAYGGRSPIRSVAIYGGVRMDRQVRSLRQWPEIVVATPGRLLDHVRQGTIDLGTVEVLVLDEADRMLDMGFIHDIKRILALLPRERQTLLFSATFSPTIRRLAEDLLRDPASVDVAPRNATPTPIRQLVHPVDKARKRHLLAHMVRGEGVGQVLVFTRTKRGANRLAEQLGKDGIRATAIHGNKSQSQRVRALAGFKKGEARCWWPPISRRVASTSRRCRTSSTTSCRRCPRTTSIASVGPVEPARRAPPSRWCRATSAN